MLGVGAGPFGLDMKGGPGTARRRSLWSLTGAGPAPSPRAPCSLRGVCVFPVLRHIRAHGGSAHGGKHGREGKGLV